MDQQTPTTLAATNVNTNTGASAHLSATLAAEHSHAILAADFDVADAINLNTIHNEQLQLQELEQTQRRRMRIPTMTTPTITTPTSTLSPNVGVSVPIPGSFYAHSNPQVQPQPHSPADPYGYVYGYDIAGLQLQEQYAAALQEILDRYHDFTLAKQEGRLGTCPKALANLPQTIQSLTSACNHNNVDNNETGNSGNGTVTMRHREHEAESSVQMWNPDVCTLCLEEFSVGDKYTTLPCGHSFHTGRLKSETDDSEDTAGTVTEDLNTGSLETESSRPNACAKMDTDDQEDVTEQENITGHARKRADTDSIDVGTPRCRGILYWLENHQTCPQCRQALPPKYPQPSKSEQIIVPLLHRQYSVISKKARVIQQQERQILQLKKQITELTQINKIQQVYVQEQRKREANNNKVSLPPPDLANLFEERAEIQERLHRSKPAISVSMTNSSLDLSALRLPQPTWQDTVLHRELRMKILSQVTQITMKDVHLKRSSFNSGITNRLMLERERLFRLHALAAKVELLLFCLAKDMESYVDPSTLRDRTLHTIKLMVAKAQSLRQDREQQTLATPVGTQTTNMPVDNNTNLPRTHSININLMASSRR